MTLTKIIANTPKTPNNSDAQDWASMLNAIVGDVSGVLTYGNELEVEIVNDNKIKIKDGVYSLQGHMIRIHEGTDLELIVNSGTLGVKRIDLLVVTYEKNINNQEDDVFKFEVVQGDAIASNEGNPVPPNITQNNLLEGGIKRQEVLYELHLNETTLSLVDKRQFVTSIHDLENRVEDGFLDLEKSALVYKGSTNNLDSINESGFYMTGQNTSNKPSDSVYGGVCVHMYRGGQSAVQLHIDTVSGKVMSRGRSASGTWGNWI